MAQVIIRDLDASVVSAIKARAALNGRSMEAELRAVLEEEFDDKAFKRDREALIKKIGSARGRLPKLPKGMTTQKIIREMRDEC